jgi:hypothetical protein
MGTGGNSIVVQPSPTDTTLYRKQEIKSNACIGQVV